MTPDQDDGAHRKIDQADQRRRKRQDLARKIDFLDQVRIVQDRAHPTAYCGHGKVPGEKCDDQENREHRNVVFEQHAEDEPEVRTVVLPLNVPLVMCEQEEEPGDRQQQHERPAGHVRG